MSIIYNSLKIQQDFFSYKPVKTIIWKDYFQDIIFGDPEWQEEILKNTLKHDSLNKFPIKSSYQLAFLKGLISEIEINSCEVISELYLKLNDLLLMRESNDHFVHYLINKCGLKRIILKEKRQIISQGTTGLCSWEASKAFGEWILINSEKFKNKHILELGSGVGFLGIIVSIFTSPKVYTFSDCHPAVLEMLQTNILLNLDLYNEKYIKKASETENEWLNIYIEKEDQKMKINILDLPWEEIGSEKMIDVKPEIILAADIIYDKSLFKILIKAFQYFINIQKPPSEIIFAATERNESTLEEFTTLLLEQKFSCREFEMPLPEIINFSTIPSIKFFHIKKET